MNYTEIEAQYNLACIKYKEKEERLHRLIERHQKSLRKLENQYLGWVDGLLKPLADEISKRLGNLPYEIYGPFGLSAETSVYFFTGSGHNICKDETYGLTGTPRSKVDDGGNFSDWSLVYFTGKDYNNYPSGSIGALNHFGYEYRPMPDDIGEIIKLLSHSPAKEE